MLELVWVAGIVVAGVLMGKTAANFLFPSKNKLFAVIPYILFSATIGLRNWVGDENALMLLPFFLLVFYFCYDEKWYASIVTGLIFYVFTVSVNMMVDTFLHNHYNRAIASAFWNNQDVAFGSAQFFYQLLTLGIKLLLWLFFWLFLKKSAPKERVVHLSKNLWYLTGALSLAPLFSILSLTLTRASGFTSEECYTVASQIAFISLPFTMLSAVALLVALVVLCRYEELEEKTRVTELQTAYYQNLLREQKEVRVLKHDMHNHIAVVRNLIRQDDSAAADRYLEEILETPALQPSVRLCENNIANAVFTNKFALMKQAGIVPDWKLSLPKTLSIPDIELCSLLGNALDNAIEAVKTMEDPQNKTIRIRARADKGVFMLRVENPFQKSPARKNGAFKTSKADKKSHGYGLSCMNQIVRKYNGSIETEIRDKWFELLVFMEVDPSCGQ